jgi:hypothetical protein
MSIPSRLFGLGVMFALGVIAVSALHDHAVAQDKEKPKEKAAEVTKWEYRILVMRDRVAGRGGFGKGGAMPGDVKDIEDELNKLGEEGFEIAFATASQATTPGGGFGKATDGSLTPVVYYTLKRAKK